jgi:hypothetical protein
MEIIFKGADFEHWLYLLFEAKGYTIGLELTIPGNTRIRVWESDNEFTVDLTWCCGNEPVHINRLLNAALEVVDRGTVWDALPHSNINPYFNDPDFLAWVSQFTAVYYDLTLFLSLLRSLFIAGKKLPQYQDSYYGQVLPFINKMQSNG